MITEVSLPWPPALNSYYRVVNGRPILSAKGRQYRADVLACPSVWLAPRWSAEHRLKVSVIARPPDRRRRDLDGMLKAVLDALTHAGIYADDSQIDDLSITREPSEPGGALLITIEKVGSDTPVTP